MSRSHLTNILFSPTPTSSKVALASRIMSKNLERTTVLIQLLTLSLFGEWLEFWAFQHRQRENCEDLHRAASVVLVV